MKKLLTILFVILIVGITFGQEYRTNDYGILFGIGDDFLSPPRSIAENGIGFMIHLDNYALRPTLQFGTLKEKNGTEETSSIFGLGAALIKHLNENKVSPYYGAGFDYSSTKKENSTEQSSSAFYIYGLCGVDFYVCKNVSLGAEYHLGYRKTSSKIDYSSSPKTLNKIDYSNQYGADYETSSSSFGFSSVMVMLTIYFM